MHALAHISTHLRRMIESKECRGMMAGIKILEGSRIYPALPPPYAEFCRQPKSDRPFYALLMQPTTTATCRPSSARAPAAMRPLAGQSSVRIRCVYLPRFGLGRCRIFFGSLSAAPAHYYVPFSHHYLCEPVIIGHIGLLQ